MAKPLDVAIVGGGMITHDLLLPAVFHLQRLGIAGAVSVCALNAAPLRSLRESAEIRSAFPEQEFRAFPALSEPPEKSFPDLYREVLASMPPRQVVVVAMPDQLHYTVVTEALRRDQHVLCVKPLVLRYAQAEEIRRMAWERGLFVGVEYHKRFDTRALMAKRHYAAGDFGEFAIGEAKMIEPYYYRSSNFQNWFTCDKTDPFVYVGCHYVDLVGFITGLKPVEVSVQGIKGRFPNGNEGYLWANARVRYANGALLNVTDGLGYPDDAAGSNEQGLQMFFEGPGRSGMLKHDDQDRGVQHSYLEGIGCGGTRFNFVSPDFFRYVPWEGAGLRPVGYGVESVAATIGMAQRMEGETGGLDASRSLSRRREMIEEADRRGIIATPANSSVNELVVEAARISILGDGEPVRIVYGERPHVEPRRATA
jgi:D-galacturonate reductase